MRGMLAVAAAGLLWAASPAWAWTWSDLRAALPPEAAWSAAREVPEAAEGIEIATPEGRLRIARWARSGDVDLLEDVRVEERGGGWMSVGRLEVEGMNLPALLRGLSSDDPDPAALLVVAVHRGARASRIVSSGGVAIDALSSFGLDTRGVWGGIRIKGLRGEQGGDRVSLALAEVRDLDLAGILADPDAAKQRAFGLVSARIEGLSAVVDGIEGRLERMTLDVGRTGERWTRLETEISGLALAVPDDLPPLMRAALGDLRELRLDSRHLEAEVAPGRWLDDGEVALAELAALRWRLDVDAPDGFDTFETIAPRAVRVELEDLGAGERLRRAFPAEAARARRSGGEIWAMLRAGGVPAEAAGEISASLSALVAGGARIMWVEGRVDAARPLRELLEGGPDAAAAYVASWIWRAGRQP